MNAACDGCRDPWHTTIDVGRACDDTALYSDPILSPREDVRTGVSVSASAVGIPGMRRRACV